MPRFDELLLDCELYNGYKPCVHGNQCGGCVHYRPLSADGARARWNSNSLQELDNPCGAPMDGQPYRVAIIKTGALGDVLRTTTLLPNLHRTHPGCTVTWITDRSAMPLLANTPLITEVLAIQDKDAVDRCLREEVYDLLINLEKEPEPLGLAVQLKASRAVGFAPTVFGKPTVFNPEARLALMLGLDDDLKFRLNTRSYPQVVAEACGLNWQRDSYVLELGPRAISTRDGFLVRLKGENGDRSGNGGGVPSVIGLNTGCGSVFRTKQWLESHWVDLARRLTQHGRNRVVILGGPAESEMNRRILESVPAAIDGGCDLPLEEFTGMVEACDLLVSSDTLGMHVAIARRKPVVVLFGSTSAVEIDLFDLGEKVVTDFPCAPCYKRTCDFDPWCMEKLMPEQVEAAVLRWLPREMPAEA
jgi:ADP-heptose:LPS heptosyltransferase